MWCTCGLHVGYMWDTFAIHNIGTFMLAMHYLPEACFVSFLSLPSFPQPYRLKAYEAGPWDAPALLAPPESPVPLPKHLTLLLTADTEPNIVNKCELIAK